ncbi:MAG: hypothetical protein OHK0012_01290 [Synechococcales cyanobacterium]
MKKKVWLVMALLLLGLCLGGCGRQVPRSVVEQALQWQVIHPQGIRNELVGSAALSHQVKITQEKVQRDRRWREAGLTGRHISGTYVLTLTQRHPIKKQLPFDVVLVPEGDPPQWLLAIPDSQGWKVTPIGLTGEMPDQEASGAEIPSAETLPSS